ncbi:MFS transporter [Caulobacter sp.]|uniref:MFS transporter n=1 Tax=Caulobacter sp. TaxID=78 RepID=UPI001B0EE09A|nr:MFS transporter [Caulobacter sp.]MBO9543844.1 MFS transporter [Caulobacter sp.]
MATDKKPIWLILAVCLLAAMLEGFDIQSMGVAAPRMVPALGLTPGQAGWAFSASLIGLMLGASAGGAVADRIGRRPVLVFSAAAFGLFSLATPLARDFEALLVVRILTGVGLGGAMPMLIALASEQAGPARKTVTVGLVTAGLPLGGAVAGLLARSPLAEDWRMIFVVGGVAPLLAAPLLHLVLPLGRPQAIERQGRAALSALFSPRRLPITVSLWLGVALTALILHLLLNWLPTLLVARGLPKSAASGAAALFNLGGAAGGVLLGLLVDRIGPRWPLVGTFAGLALALLGLAAAGDGGEIALLAFVAGFLLMGGQFTLYSLAPQLYAEAVRGSGIGAAIAASRLGSIFGPLAAAQLIGAGAAGGAVVGALVPVALATGLSAGLLTVLGARAAKSEAP